MNAAAIDMTPASAAPQRVSVFDRSAVHDGTFAAAMAAVDARRALPIPPVIEPAASSTIEPASALGALARQLDALGRHRVEAQALADDLAGAWASGVDGPALAVSMHRQARAMASYNLSVMWGAKLVAVTAGALRQLVSAA